MSSSSVAVSKKPSSLQASAKKLMSFAFFFSLSAFCGLSENMEVPLRMLAFIDCYAGSGLTVSRRIPSMSLKSWGDKKYPDCKITLSASMNALSRSSIGKKGTYSRSYSPKCALRDSI